MTIGSFHSNDIQCIKKRGTPVQGELYSALPTGFPELIYSNAKMTVHEFCSMIVD
jgi:hypothetical protein